MLNTTTTEALLWRESRGGGGGEGGWKVVEWEGGRHTLRALHSSYFQASSACYETCRTADQIKPLKLRQAQLSPTLLNKSSLLPSPCTSRPEIFLI